MQGLLPNRVVAERYGLAIVGDVILLSPSELDAADSPVAEKE